MTENLNRELYKKLTDENIAFCDISIAMPDGRVKIDTHIYSYKVNAEEGDKFSITNGYTLNLFLKLNYNNLIAFIKAQQSRYITEIAENMIGYCRDKFGFRFKYKFVESGDNYKIYDLYIPKNKTWYDFSRDKFNCRIDITDCSRYTITLNNGDMSGSVKGYWDIKDLIKIMKESQLSIAK